MRYGKTDMVFKKNFLSYCLWILYTFAAATGLFAFAAYICFKMGYPAWNGFAACLGLLLAEALACAFFHTMNSRGKNKRHYNKNNIKLSVAEGLAVVAILGIILAMRIISISYASSQSSFFDQAMVRSGVKIEPSFQSSVYFYLKTLNLICFVFGNKIAAGYVFQIILQLLAFVMLYFAVRKISGILPALCAILFPGIIANFNDAAFTLSPKSMLFFIFALVLLIVSACFGRGGNQTAVWLIAGASVGFFSGVEIAGCVLFFVALGSNFVRDSNKAISKAVLCNVALIIGIVIGFAGYTFFNSAVNGVGFEAAFSEWIKLIEPGPINAGQLGYIPFLGYDNVAVLFVLCFGIFSFFLNGRSYGHGLWTFAAAVLVAFAVTEGSAGESMEVGMLYIVLTILAGIAVKNVLPIPEMVPVEGDVAEAAEEEYVVEDIGAVSEEKEKNSMFSVKSKEGKKNNDGSDKERSTVCTGTPGKTVTVNVDGESRQIKLLDNPLTLPKKREHKAMDYDIEVPEDDDYDIK